MHASCTASTCRRSRPAFPQRRRRRKARKRQLDPSVAFRVSAGRLGPLRVSAIVRRAGGKRQSFTSSTAGAGGAEGRLFDRLHLQRRTNDSGSERRFREALRRPRQRVARLLGQGAAARGGGKKSEPLGLRRGQRLFAGTRSPGPGKT